MFMLQQVLLLLHMFDTLYLYIQDHTRFVNIVRFSPDGELVCSGGADGQAIILNGKTSEKVSGLGGTKAHAGGIYCVSSSLL